LDQAALDRSRLDRYLTGIKETSDTDCEQDDHVRDDQGVRRHNRPLEGVQQVAARSPA